MASIPKTWNATTGEIISYWETENNIYVMVSPNISLEITEPVTKRLNLTVSALNSMGGFNFNPSISVRADYVAVRFSDNVNMLYITYSEIKTLKLLFTGTALVSFDASDIDKLVCKNQDICIGTSLQISGGHKGGIDTVEVKGTPLQHLTVNLVYPVKIQLQTDLLKLVTKKPVTVVGKDVSIFSYKKTPGSEIYGVHHA